ncbi:Fur family transcriptional regulator [Tamlana nanhaiensis]|uniref:Fur family transcriptional regulator n=1 Tax=Neotamlana nanhaiensis TaxID=1382798 RepID=A0A0D7W5S4_9FLAO|nr:transcriptional repressor [Tamlana nanhaiensis]KJD34374.1 Fur family transcriptional regulator [Tamlana nanhaiensis]
MRKTVANTEILRLITESETTLSHADIKSLLPEGLCDRVTIYRVLDRLVEEGLIHKVVNIDGVVNYASCDGCTTKHHHNHVHFNCEKCNAVTCLDNVEPTFKLPEGYSVKEMNFVISGLCPNCN